MKSVSGRGKIKRTISANVLANTNTNAHAHAGGGSNSISRKTRSRNNATVSRKSRKPAVLPCSLNECHAVEEDEEGTGAGATGGSGSDDDASCEKQQQQQQQQEEQNGDKGGGGVDPSIKTVESALEGDQQPRVSENLAGDTDGAIEEARREEQGSDPQPGNDKDSEDVGGGGADSESGGADSANEDDGGAGGGSTSSGDDSEGGEGKKGKERETRHIHPCICDLSTKAQARIKAHIRKRELFELRHTQRLESIDAELRAIEEEIARKQQEELEQEELFGDKYELVGKKKKRIKRSARRASMVSLGVKQVINWKKSPKIKVRHNQASNLRKNFTAYCGDRPVPLPEIKHVGYGQSPKIPVRVTKAASLRGETNSKKKQYYIDNEDKRPIFDVSPFY